MVLFLTMEIEDYTFTLPSCDDEQDIEGIKVLLPDGFTNNHLISHAMHALLLFERRWRQQGPDEEGGKKFVLLSPLKGDTWKMSVDEIKSKFKGGCNFDVVVITKTD